jgi:uncharacterized protein
VEPDAVEMRVLGCLLEKQRTTPDAYPLTLNALRLACNQATNRYPVVDYDEREIRAALERLGRRRWTRLASWGNSRVMKYRHLIDETLELSDAELSLLAVLMLRGPQTAGELNQRTERLHRFEPSVLEQTLADLGARELVRQLPRQPGERGQRYVQLLGGDSESEPVHGHQPAVEPGSAELAADAGSERAEGGAPDPAGDRPSGQPKPSAVAVSPAAEGPRPSAARAVAAPTDASLVQAELVGRVEHLEGEVSSLRDQLRSLRDQFRDLREQLGG